MSRTLLWAFLVVAATVNCCYAWIQTRLPFAFQRSPTHKRLFRPFSARMTLSASSTGQEVTPDVHDAGVSAKELLPWTQSIKTSRDLSYMPMFAHHLEKVKQMGMVEIPVEEEFECQYSATRPARIASKCFKNEKYRKVRFTYFDAGDAVQVFNAVWYPAYQYDLPILGMDLISIGNSNKQRVINVMDFQPLHNTPEYSAKYIDHLSTIRDKYPELHETLSGKIYHDALFFSKNMLFGRLPDESCVSSVVYPAYEEYVNAYTTLMEQAKPDFSYESMRSVRDRQSAYDAYNTVKDPAVGIYNAYFGKDWSHRFVHDFLFDKCREGSYVTPNTTTGCAVTTCGDTSTTNVEGGNNDAANTRVCASTEPVHSFKIDDTTGDISFLNKPSTAL